MKKIRIFWVLFVLALTATTLTNCDEEPAESCTNDEFCDEKFVTACCDANQECVYKFDGKEYTVDEQAQLADDLGCSGSGARVSSEARMQLINKLENLLQEAKAGLH